MKHASLKLLLAVSNKAESSVVKKLFAKCHSAIFFAANSGMKYIEKFAWYEKISLITV